LNLPPHIKKHALAGLHKSNITESQSILSPETCAKLREQVDDHFTANHDSVDNGPDYQRKLTRPELTAFLGADADTFWSRIPTSSQTRIFIRRYTPSTRPWIPFHTDSSFLTINVALNSPSEYTGGALLALALGRVVAIGGRTAGSVTQHDSTLLHGVTRMVTGTRYTLIVFVGTCHARVEELMFREGCEGERVALVELLEGTRVMEEVLGKERTEEVSDETRDCKYQSPLTPRPPRSSPWPRIYQHPPSTLPPSKPSASSTTRRI